MKLTTPIESVPEVVHGQFHSKSTIQILNPQSQSSIPNLNPQSPISIVTPQSLNRQSSVCNLQSTVSSSVDEVDDNPDGHPADEPFPGSAGQAEHQCQADRSREQRQDGNPRRSKGARQIGT